MKILWRNKHGQLNLYRLFYKFLNTKLRRCIQRNVTYRRIARLTVACCSIRWEIDLIHGSSLYSLLTYVAVQDIRRRNRAFYPRKAIIESCCRGKGTNRSKCRGGKRRSTREQRESTAWKLTAALDTRPIKHR